MTRARPRALENEVTSFLSDITFDSLETWLLPKSDMLCMIRCQEESPEDAREDEQAAKSTDEDCATARTSGRSPGHPAPRETPDIRAPARKSGPRLSREHRNSPGQPGHPGSSPDIRPLLKPRTSGPMPGHPAPPTREQ